MSGVVKSVKKVFKKVVKFVKKALPVIAIAVAAYFTAGVALSFMPATQAFAASMPGFAGGGFLGLGVGEGAVAGAGVFTKAATAIGLGGGLAEGAIAANTAAAASALEAGASVASVASQYGVGAVEAAKTGMIAGNVAAGTGVSAAEAVGAAGLTGSGASAATSIASTTAGGGTIAPAAKAGLSLTDKLLLAKTGTDLAGAVFGPTPEEEWEAKAAAEGKWQGAFYGMDSEGGGAYSGAPMADPRDRYFGGPGAGPATTQQEMVRQPTQQTPTQRTPTQPGSQPGSQPLSQMAAGADLFQGPPGEGTSPMPAASQFAQSQGIPAPSQPIGQMAQAGGLFDEQQEEEQGALLYGSGPMKQQIDVPHSVFAPVPGVRYV